MPIDREALERITEYRDRAEGFVTDAEFREEVDVKNMRYYQAMSHLLLAIADQNSIMIGLMAKMANEDLDEG